MNKELSHQVWILGFVICEESHPWMMSPSVTEQQGPFSLLEMTWWRTNSGHFIKHFYHDDTNVLHQIIKSYLYTLPTI